jgi:4-diphosphocytidyl-2-C-methyl-D-erythritol kinase
VPSQLAPERCLMTGIGEGVRRLGDPGPFGLLIVPSDHALSTAAVYGEFDRLGLGRDPDELDRLSGQVPGAARDESLLAERLLHNDLEAPARSLCPPIGDALADVRASGAVRAMVSGSGPTVFGLFPGADGPGHAQAAAAALRERHPHAVAARPVGRAFAAPVEA